MIEFPSTHTIRFDSNDGLSHLECSVNISGTWSPLSVSVSTVERTRPTRRHKFREASRGGVIPFYMREEFADEFCARIRAAIVGGT